MYLKMQISFAELQEMANSASEFLKRLKLNEMMKLVIDLCEIFSGIFIAANFLNENVCRRKENAFDIFFFILISIVCLFIKYT